jgi:hypothetical protein
MTKKEYNDVPVAYCTKCISLRIVSLTGMKEVNFDTPKHYCDNCGSAEINETHIENFKLKYKKFYGKDHLTGDKQLDKE